MVKHIVMYTLKEAAEKAQAVELIRSVLEPLVGKIPGLLHLEIRQALADYAGHPLHLEAKKHFCHLIASRYAADYEV